MNIRDIRLPKSFVVIKKTDENVPGLIPSEKQTLSLADWINYAIQQGIIDVSSKIKYLEYATNTYSIKITYEGLLAPMITEFAVGEYNISIPLNTGIHSITFYGNLNTLNESNELVIKVINDDNNYIRRCLAQVYDNATNTSISSAVSGVYVRQTEDNYTTTLLFTTLDNLSSLGYTVEIR